MVTQKPIIIWTCLAKLLDPRVVAISHTDMPCRRLELGRRDGLAPMVLMWEGSFVDVF